MEFSELIRLEKLVDELYKKFQILSSNNQQVNEMWVEFKRIYDAKYNFRGDNENAAE